MDAEVRIQIQATLLEHYGEAEGRRIVDELASRYRLTEIPITAFVNLTLREGWRIQHGDTDQWDAAARAAGFNPALFERGRPILKGATA